MIQKIKTAGNHIASLCSFAGGKVAKATTNRLLAEFSNRIELSHAYGQPVHAQIESTTYCNSKCPMCSREGIVRGKQKHMSFGNFKKIIAKLPYCREIHLQGLGEPLLNPDIARIAKVCSQSGVKAGFTTNASVLSESLSRKLILSGLGFIEFSIDSADARLFEMLRGGAKLSDVERNIRQFVALKVELSSSTPVIRGKTIVSDKNIKGIPQLLKLLSSIGIKNVLLRHPMHNPFLRNVPSRQLELLEGYKKYGRYLGIDVNLLFPRLSPLSARKMVKCWKLWKSVYITVGGYVTPCCFFPDKKDSCGNILKQDFCCVWNGSLYKSLRERLKKGTPGYPCRECIWAH